MSNEENNQTQEQRQKALDNQAEFGTNCYLKGWQDAFEAFKVNASTVNINRKAVKDDLLKAISKANEPKSRIIRP